MFLFPALMYGQKNNKELTPENLAILQAYEDTLQFIGDSVVLSSDWSMREQACIVFLKELKYALKVENSYQFPFDSVVTM